MLEQLSTVRHMSALPCDNVARYDHMMLGRVRLFGLRRATSTTSAEGIPPALPRWDDSSAQRLLRGVASGEPRHVRDVGAAGFAALEEKAAEIHGQATEGDAGGCLLADLEQTTWDAAEVLAWLRAAERDRTELPHRDADSVVPIRHGADSSAGYWQLDNGDVVRFGSYSSPRLRAAIADGDQPHGELFLASASLPDAVARLMTASVEFTWSLKGVPMTPAPHQ